MVRRDKILVEHLYTELRKTEQQVMLLHYAEGMTKAEIAAALDLHVETVDILLHRIRCLAQSLLTSCRSAKRRAAGARVAAI